MANCFIHFEPIGPIGGQVELTGDLPPYLIPGSVGEEEWRKANPDGHHVVGKHGTFATGSTELHHHALEGNVEKVRETLDKHGDLINVRDKNGWSALDESIRKGAIDLVRLLLDHGAEVNGRTGPNQTGSSSLELAKKYVGDDHEITELLRQRGANERLTEL